MSKYKIEKNYPLPTGVKLAKKAAKNVSFNENAKYPIYDLDLGDSFVVTNTTARELRNTIHRKAQRQGMRFVSRTTVTKAGKVKARVWRTK